jgi:tetratricopeptide (TPR) repeat protein
MYRYKGDRDQMLHYCNDTIKFATEMNSEGQIKEWTKTLKIIEDGEPLNRMIVTIGNQDFELSELKAATLPFSGNIKFGFKRNRRNIPLSEYYMNLGKNYGSQGQYERAVEMFKKAHEVDPYRPDSKYEEGYTLLKVGKGDEAAKAYQKCKELAPSWYNVNFDCWIAEQLRDGKLIKEDVDIIMMLVDGTLKGGIDYDMLIQKMPNVPRLYYLLGKQQESSNLAAAMNSWKKGLTMEGIDIDTKTRLLLSLSEEIEEYLDECVALKGHLQTSTVALLYKIGLLKR